MRNIRLLIEYKGTNFAGWQIQDKQATVQGALTEAIFRVTGEQVSLIGAGRTDAGVHALGQVANFRIEHQLETTRFRDALNYYLPDDIRVLQSDEAEFSFHARFDAVWRRYRYLVSPHRSALYREYRYEVADLPEPGALQQAAAMVPGEHDFSAFCVTASRKEDNRCTIYRSSWRSVGPLLVYEIRGNRFLHSMVRSLVGAMLNLADSRPDANRDNLTLAAFQDIILAPQDRRIRFTAPAHGLYLVAVGYNTRSD
jgi:tRNA pseudouridine38-40 synthase